MWYPNKSQWYVIWIFSLLALGVWVQQVDFVYMGTKFVPTGEQVSDVWGPKTRPVETIKFRWDRAGSRLALSCLLIGALIVWEISSKSQSGYTVKTSKTQPLPPSMKNWYAVEDGKSVGPMSEEELIDGMRSGRYSSQTFVFTKGMSEWTPAGKIPELDVLPASPIPPLPGS